MQYRFAQPDELSAVARLVAHSFIGRGADWWEEQLRDPPYGGGAETLLIGVAEGRPIAALQVHRLRQWIAGSALDVAGVGTVTISPVHRKQGLAAELMGAALRAAYDRGDVGSALYPFRSSFYRKLGYGTAGRAEQHLVPPSALPDDEGRKRTVLLDDDVGRKAALELYNEWIKTQNGQLERTFAHWEKLCTAPDRGLVGSRDAAGKLDGYALVTYRGDLPLEQRYLDVDEVVFTTLDARRSLYAWLASLGDQWQRIMLRALPSQRLPDWLKDGSPPGSVPSWGLWAPSAVLLNGPMFRIVNMETVWQGRRVAPQAAFAVTLDLVDEQLAENHGGWTLEFQDERVDVQRDTAAKPRLRTDVSTLSRMYAGALTGLAARDAGLLSCADDALLERLDRVLALPEPWTFDRF